MSVLKEKFYFKSSVWKDDGFNDEEFFLLTKLNKHKWTKDIAEEIAQWTYKQL